MKRKKSKFSISRLFYNDRFVMVFSVLVAFGIWFMISTSSQETTIFTITDIPVTLPELSNDLKFFEADDLTAEVKISGNAIVVAGVTNSDIYITASDTSEITAPGKYKVNLVPKKSGLKSDYSFESTVSPSSVEVYVDRYAEKEFPITDKVDVSSVAQDYYASATLLSQQTVKVKGAESVINSIAEVAAEYVFSDPLSKTTTTEAALVFYDSDGNEVSQQYIEPDKTSIGATVPVLKVKTVDIVPVFTNAPSTFVYDSTIVKVEPSQMQIAVPDDVTDNITSISTASIDLSDVNLRKSEYEVELEIPSGCRDLNQVSKAKVTFDKTLMSSKKVTLKSFTVINQASERKTSVTTKSIDIVLIGDKTQLSVITADNITAVVDMSSKSNLTGFAEMPVTISINSKFPMVWPYGTYKVDVSVSDTTQESSAETSS